MVIKRYISGSLDKDSSPYTLRNGDYSHACDIITTRSNGVVKSMIGNRLVSFSLPAGTNTVTGAHADPYRNNIIYFVYNSDGYHSILKYDNSSRTITKILQSKTDSAGVDILNLQADFPVNDIDIIHREEEGDLLLFNDGFNRPGLLNIELLETGFYTPVPEYVIRLAKKPPQDAPTVYYDSDPDVKVNNFKKKLFQFKYRWVYGDGFTSTWSPSSKVALPLDAYAVETESDPTKNNVIYVSTTGGGVDYTKIQIAARESVGTVYGDWFLIDTLDKDEFSIPSGGTYNYRFTNDGAYSFIDVPESNLLFDWTADKCNAQTIVNGNVVVQAGITDGYDPIPRNEIDVTLTASLIETKVATSIPATPTITYFQGIGSHRYYLTFTIGTSVAAGCVYTIKFKSARYAGDDVFANVTYTANDTDTRDTVAAALNTLLVAVLYGSHLASGTLSGGRVNIDNSQRVPDAYAFENIVVKATALTLKTGGSPTWKWGAKYRTGLVYFDQYGKTNGVVTHVSDDTDPTDFSVTTDDFTVSNVVGDTFLQPKIPIILASINHLPPSWATSFQWVRTQNLSVSMFVQYITSDVVTDTNHIYLGLKNLYKFREENTGFIPNYEFAAGDRVRVLASLSGQDYTTDVEGADYEILGMVEQYFGEEEDGVEGKYIKISKPLSDPAYANNMLIEIYRPALRNTETEQVFYEFGESYPIYEKNGVRYHLGGDQNQTDTQPATFTFLEGDVYFKFRSFFTDTLLAEDIFQQGLMDANYSDFYSSAVNSNGRPNIVDPNARHLYNPVSIRFSQAYQPGTDINGLNRFYAENVDEYVRSYGEIKRMISWNNNLIIFQRHKIGAVPVYQQILKDVSGNDNVAISDQLLNGINYYLGEYGIGDMSESIAWNDSSIYGWDNNAGIAWRLGRSGLEPISLQKNMNEFVTDQLATGGKVLGVFDNRNKLYLSIFETGSKSALSWSAIRNGFMSFHSFRPERACNLANLLVTFKNGQLYTHDSPTYANYYGVQYKPELTVTFNDRPDLVKGFVAISAVASQLWECPEVVTNNDQLSSLITDDFKLMKGTYHASFLRDMNSPKGLLSGDRLAGHYISVTLSPVDGADDTELTEVDVTFKLSHLNNR